MTDQLILNDPVGRLLQLLNRMKEVDPSKRLVIGLVGLPGSGKSTLAANIVDEVNVRTNATRAVALCMDGFHLTKSALAQFADPAVALQRRGSPWTFDPVGLANKLLLLRKNTDESTTWPDFQHGVGDPVADAIALGGPAPRDRGPI